MKSQLSLVPKFSLLLVNERHELCIYIWPYEKKLARNNFYFEPILLGLFMGWQIKKKLLSVLWTWEIHSFVDSQQLWKNVIM